MGLSKREKNVRFLHFDRAAQGTSRDCPLIGFESFACLFSTWLALSVLSMSLNASSMIPQYFLRLFLYI